MTDSLNDRVRALEHRVDELLALCERYREENRILRESQESLNADRASLLEKNEQARSKIEAMISRLKGMEQN